MQSKEIKASVSYKATKQSVTASGMDTDDRTKHREQRDTRTACPSVRLTSAGFQPPLYPLRSLGVLLG